MTERRLREQVSEEMVLYDFLRLTIGLTKRQIRQLKYRRPGILVNGERQYVTARLAPGDVVEVDVEGRSEPKPLAMTPGPLDILYEDEDLIALNKPAGMPTHPGGVHQTDTLVNLLMYYFHEKGESRIVRPAGRLDKETSGVILFAKNQVAAGRLVRQKERGLLRKEYLAIVQGKMPEKAGIIDAPLRRDPENACRVIWSPEGKQAVTGWEVLRETASCSLLRVRLQTGRMHQIRAHLAGTGYPLLGDTLYGGDPGLIGRAALHAWQMKARQPFTDEAFCWEAPLPEDMRRAMEFAGGETAAVVLPGGLR